MIMAKNYIAFFTERSKCSSIKILSFILFIIMLFNISNSTIASAASGVMSVEDFVLDSNEFKDQIVKLRGNISCLQDVCTIDGEEAQNASVSIETKTLPRDDRKRLLRCEVMSPCLGTVTGRVRKNFIDEIEIQVSAITFLE
jgi:hypothetical protein